MIPRLSIVAASLVLFVALFAGLSAPADAQVVITGTNVQMTWEEPVASVDGGALNDLASTSGFYEIPGDIERLCGTVPATSPSDRKSVV